MSVYSHGYSYTMIVCMLVRDIATMALKSHINYSYAELMFSNNMVNNKLKYQLTCWQLGGKVAS